MNGVNIIIPVLRRPHRVQIILDNIEAATAEPHLVLFVADIDDADEIAALQAACATYITVDRPRNYAAKINAGYRSTDLPILFSAADDLNFHPGWYSTALACMVDGIDVVGTNDMANPRTMRGEHSTHTLFRRSYIDTIGGVIGEAGVVLHEGYPHQYCDDEFVQTAMARGRYAHAFDSLVEHLHPIVGDRPNKLPDDDTYRLGRNPARTQAARRLFQRRQRLWQS